MFKLIGKKIIKSLANKTARPPDKSAYWNIIFFISHFPLSIKLKKILLMKNTDFFHNTRCNMFGVYLLQKVKRRVWMGESGIHYLLKNLAHYSSH